MIWTKSDIEQLKEDDLSRQVLVPLFAAMGYQDVRFHGGGILEQGKDITMWRVQEPRGRLNAAAVVKAGPITGEASTAMVITQLRQAFAAPFKESATGDEQYIHECFIVTPTAMKKEAVYTLRNVIDAEPFGRYVTTIDGTELWRLISKHLGPRATLGAILENYRRLNAHRTLELGMQLEPGHTSVTIRSKDGEPVEVGTPTFPDTVEGAANRAAFERFLQTGETTELKLEHLSGFSPTDFADQFGLPTDVGIVRLKANPTLAMDGDLCCRSDSGDEVVIPGLVFTATGGTSQLTLTNEAQDVPLHFEIRIAFDSTSIEGSTATFHMRSECVGWSIYWYVLYLQFLRVTTRAGTAVIRDRKTGIEHKLGVLTVDREALQTDYHYELARRTLYVQQLVKQPILVPRREFFTKEDIENLAHVEEIVTRGRQNANSMQFELVPTQGDDEEWQKRLSRPVTNLIARSEGVQRLVLDTYVALGPAEFKCTQGTMTAEDVQESAAKAARGESISVKVVPSRKGRIIATYPLWKGRSQR
jgi:hypothetical protein